MPELPRSIPRSWSSTLKLPKSSFPPRTSPADQHKYLQRCTDDLYAWQRRERPANQTFTLHDGPPYANGELHIGHALNKILKDMFCRLQLAKGKRVDYVPGWDCHGLPIELKAQKEATDDIRKAARSLAARTVRAQIKEFRRWAVMADWDGHWKTMDKGFEKRQLGVFREMVDRGLIYRRFKPVYWSPSTRTALAEAELEYKDDHVSTAALVKFPLVFFTAPLVDDPVFAVIWTTTPWTLPANAAIAVNPAVDYCIVRSERHGCLLVALSRLSYLASVLGEDPTVVIPSITGWELADKTTYVPLLFAQKNNGPPIPQPIITAGFVTADSGTGLVHCAPGHGMDDYEACLSRGIAAFAPVDDAGRFTDKVSNLAGKFVLDDGNKAVLQHVDDHGYLIDKHRYQHKYPYDWRSKLPIIIRATEQWFADVGDIRDGAIEALQDVHFTPASGRHRLENFVRNRSEWCISRQRAWGVPIPALYDRRTGDAVLTNESVSHIMAIIEDRGIDAWWTDDADDVAWIPSSLRGESFEYRRGTDTMDVWFDSGTSWTMSSSASPANVYLEGSDQHRGWFQSSLLTYAAHQTQRPFRAPFRHLVTHGFTLDEDGRKMSKSVGNVIHPQMIMDGTLLPPLKRKKGKQQKRQEQADNQQPVIYDALGPDALRLWVASSDYTRDVVIGKEVLQTVNTSLHKYRVTFKVLLGALSDFNVDDLVPYDQLQKVDRIALMQLAGLVLSCQNAFDSYEFYRAVAAINRWANLDFSAFYMESIKDRLYTYGEESASRRAAQTTLFHIYTHLQEVLGPIVPMLIEETWEHSPEAIKCCGEHPLRRTFTSPKLEWQQDSTTLDWDYRNLMAANSAIKDLQETARANKQVGSSLQSFVHITVPDDDVSVFEHYEQELADIFVVSSVTLGRRGIPDGEIHHAQWKYASDFDLPGGRKGCVHVYAPQAAKCPRCWRYAVPEGEGRHDQLCHRCEEVVHALDV